MTSRRLLFLGAAAIAALAAALLLSNPHSSADQKTAGALYPSLKDQIDSVNAVRIFKAGDARAVELVRKDAVWTVSERSDYPADPAKVRRLLLALVQAKPVEEKTSTPENYPTLGVEDVSNATATGVRLELEGATPPVNLIVGKSAGANAVYVRRAGEPASWLVDQNLEASTTAHDWLTSGIVDVAADRVQSATVTLTAAKPYSAAKAARTDADFKIDGLPKGKELDAYAANSFGTALTGLTLTDVRPATDFAADKPAAHATFRTFDGLVVDLDGWMKDSKHYVAAATSYDAQLAKRFAVEAPTADKAEGKRDAGAAPKPATDEAAARKMEDAAKSTHARLQGWVYEIPEYEYEAIFKPAGELAKK